MNTDKAQRTSKFITSHLRELMEDLTGENTMAREKARLALVDIGEPAIDYLSELVYSNNVKFRWEGVKALSEMSEPDAIPFLIDALDDENAGVRWLAAEGLIRIGQPTLRPLLEALIARRQSPFLYQGAHHVLHELGKAEFTEEISSLLSALKESAARTKILVSASELLRKVKSRDRLNPAS